MESTGRSLVGSHALRSSASPRARERAVDSAKPRRFRRAALIVITSLAAIAAMGSTGCNTSSKPSDVKSEPKPSAPASAASAPASPAQPAAEGALRLGAPIEGSAQKVALADVAKNSSSYVGKKFVTTGTVTAVCQHMGCWMEIKDDAGEAHIKMAGHSFMVPKTASGRKAKVLATLVKSDDEAACADEGHEGMSAASTGAGAAGAAKGAPTKNGAHAQKGCRAEAEAQLGRPLAKLELVAEGVELM